MKILVVDDSPLVLAFTKDALQHFGHEVITADNIFVAPIVNRFRPDVVLMDVTVSTQKGMIAVEVLKKHTMGKHCAIFLYSGQSELQLQALTQRCGADGYVEKCKDPGELHERVQGALSVYRKAA